MSKRWETWSWRFAPLLLLLLMLLFVILRCLPAYFRNSPIWGPDWMIPFSSASCGPGSLTMTVLCSCCSITTQLIRLGQRCSRTWSLPQWNMFWIRASSQFCLTQILTAGSSSVWGQVGIVSSDNSFVKRDFQPCLAVDNTHQPRLRAQGNGNPMITHLLITWEPSIWPWKSWSSLRWRRSTVLWSWRTTPAWACHRRPIQDPSSPKKLSASSR